MINIANKRNRWPKNLVIVISRHRCYKLLFINLHIKFKIYQEMTEKVINLFTININKMVCLFNINVKKKNCMEDHMG
jgi:hypothetical protein